MNLPPFLDSLHTAPVDFSQPSSFPQTSPENWTLQSTLPESPSSFQHQFGLSPPPFPQITPTRAKTPHSEFSLNPFEHFERPRDQPQIISQSASPDFYNSRTNSFSSFLSFESIHDHVHSGPTSPQMSMFSPFGTSLEIEGKSSSSRLFDEESSPFEHTMTLPLSFIDHTTEQMRISLIEESRFDDAKPTNPALSETSLALEPNQSSRDQLPFSTTSPANISETTQSDSTFSSTKKRKTRSVNRQLKERERQRRRRKFRRMMKTKGGRNQQSSNDIDDDDSTSNEQDEEECLVDADSGPNQNPVRKDQKSTPQRQNRRSIDSPQGLLPLPPPLFHTGSLLTSQPILQPSLPLFSKPSPTRHLAAPKSTQLSPSLTPSSPSIHSTQIDTHNRHPKLPFSASKVD